MVIRTYLKIRFPLPLHPLPLGEGEGSLILRWVLVKKPITIRQLLITNHDKCCFAR